MPLPNANSPAPRPIPPRTPLLIAVLALLALAAIAGPVLALGLRVPWGRLAEISSRTETHDMLKLSLAAALQATLVAMLLGVGFALWIQQLGRSAVAVRMVTYLPLAMPPVVSGLALNAAIGRRGVAAPALEGLGWDFAFAFPGVVAAQAFVALPFVIVAVDSALRQMDPEIVASARGVGLHRWEIASRIILPTIAPALATGAGLAFARALGEFGTTLTFAGSQPGVTRTMPLGIYLEREIDTEAAYGLAAILIAVALACLAAAALPAVLRRSPRPQARGIGALDVDALRELSAPPGSRGLEVSRAGRTLEFPAGSVTAIVGPNGSGKTTFASQVAGRLTGACVSPADSRVVLLTQRPGLPPRATAESAVTMVTKDRERTRRLFAAAGLTALADAPVPSLSGGQAAQVALLRALAARPAVLILDEPLAAVDVAGTSRWREFLQASSADRTTLMVTHNALDIAGIADRMLVMDSGDISHYGPAKRFLRTPPNQFVADIAGLNRVEGTVADISLTICTVECGENIVHLPRDRCARGLEVGQAAALTFSPSVTTFSPEGCAAAATGQVSFRATVVATEATTLADVHLLATIGRNRIRIPIAERSGLATSAGNVITCSAPADKVHCHPLRD